VDTLSGPSCVRDPAPALGGLKRSSQHLDE
jgi:hypothetical protein